MVFLGFLLVAAAIAAGAGVVLDNTDAASLVVFGQTVPGVSNEWQLFLAGGGVAIVFVVGLMLTFMGAVRRVRTRRDLRDMREEHEESMTSLVAEKRRLERELAHVRQGSRPGPGATPGPSGGPRPLPRREPASAVQGTRVAPRSPNPATSPFFTRND